MFDTQLKLADADVKINTAYKSLSPVKASFDCTLHADSFDIKKACNEIKLFRDMASSAAKASGISWIL